MLRTCRRLWRTVPAPAPAGAGATSAAFQKASPDDLPPPRSIQQTISSMGEPAVLACLRSIHTWHSLPVAATASSSARLLHSDASQRPWTHLTDISRPATAAVQPPSFARGMAKLPFKLPRRELPVRRSDAAESGKGTTKTEEQEAPKPMTPQDMTNAMYLPWERRQFEGGKLTWWEKSYWVILLLALAAAAVSQMYNPWASTSGDEVLNEALELRKKESARAILLGKSFLDDEDPFEGLSPEHIEKYVQSQTGASMDDPFEGMTPEEIDEYVKNNPSPQ